MSTITISLPAQIAKLIDSETKKQGFSTRSEYIRSLVRDAFAKTQVTTKDEFKFEPFVAKPLDEIRANFESIGKYNKKFIDSLIKGLSRSSAYANKTSR